MKHKNMGIYNSKRRLQHVCVDTQLMIKIKVKSKDDVGDEQVLK